jgi:DNA-binding NarL/FixJ family response regulator
MADDCPRSLLVDENDVFRAGLRDCLEAEAIEIIGETDDPKSAWTLIETDHPDLILLHSCLLPTDGVPLCERITRQYPEVKVILTDPDPSAGHNLGYAQAFRAGARACVPREHLSHEECIATVQAVLQGQYLFEEDIRLRALQLETLTPREEDVLALMAQDKPYVAIARGLHLHEGTVRNHASNILAKLGITDRRDTGLYACRRGLSSKVTAE